MKDLLNEAFKVNRANDAKGKPIAFIDPNAPENKETFKYKDVFKEYGAKWSLSDKYKYNFPSHKQGFWFWFIGDTEDQWRNVFEKLIKPSLLKVHSMQGATEDESKQSLVSSLDSMIEAIKTAKPSYDSDVVITKELTEKISEKLEGFKQKIVNIQDDENFKETMRKIIAFKSSQGHEYSINNTIMIIIQRPDAKIVKSRTNWVEYNRIINPNAKPIFLWKPSNRAIIPYNKEQKERILQAFLRDEKKNSYEELTPQQKERLKVKLSGHFKGGSFELYDAYDISDTTLIEGKEDLIQPSLTTSDDLDIKWYNDSISDEVTPLYKALWSIAVDNGIEIKEVDAEELRGARGVSQSGIIKIIRNEGNNVGITKDFAHEIAHEFLHQKYLKDRDPEMAKYFVDTTEGMDVVEQQAELCAWMVLASFGFDLDTETINYITVWGARPDKMVNIFDKIAETTNKLISEVIKRGVILKENNVDIPTGIKRYSPQDVAKILGVEREYNIALEKEKQMEEQKNKMLEHFYKLAGKKKIIR